MACFVKGVGLVRTAYKSGVSLRSAQVDFIAGNLNIRPQASGVDALSSVTVTDKSYGKAMITDPASLTELRLPNTYLAIGNNALDACVNLTDVYIYARQVIDIGTSNFAGTYHVDTEFLSAYEARYPLLTFAAFDSGYTQTIPYVEGVTPTTLTAQYVNDWVAQIGDPTAVGRVIVPAYFTEYASGAITAIQTAFTNMEHLVTTYSGGTVDLDMNGDIVAKILDIGSDLDFALRTARHIDNAATYGMSIKTYVDLAIDSNANIVPPTKKGETDMLFGYNGKYSYDNLSSLVYLDIWGFKFDNRYLNPFLEGGDAFVGNCKNLLYLHLGNYENTAGGSRQFGFSSFYGADNLKYAIFDDLSYFSASAGENAYSFPKVVRIKMANATWPITVSSTLLDRAALLDLINSLGTPSTRQTLTIGATNLAKLQPADIQLAYDKNWALSPTPAAFALEIGSDTYSCDFGMTWAQWVASAYNTDGYYVSAGSVYDSNDNIVRLNGVNVKASGMVRYGDSYTHSTTTVAYTYTVPFAGNTELTADYVTGLEVNTDTTAYRVTKAIVPSDFTGYEAGALDAVFSAFPNIIEISLNGITPLASDIEGLLSNYRQVKKLTVYDSNGRMTLNDLEYIGILKSGQFTAGLKVNTSDDLVIDVPNATSVSSAFWVDNTDDSNRHINVVANFGAAAYLNSEYGVIANGNNTRENMTITVHLGAVTTNGPGFYMLGNNDILKIYCKAGMSKPTFNRNDIRDIRLYFPTGDLVTYVSDASWNTGWQVGPWATTTPVFIGYLDYTDTIPTFTGYADAWYEDEECTTPIATTDFVSGTRYFVKLTALITFTIGGQSYNANANMTWTQWVASAYNTIGFTISNNIVTDGGSHGVSTTIMGQDWVDPSATISATEYHLVAL